MSLAFFSSSQGGLRAPQDEGSEPSTYIAQKNISPVYIAINIMIF